MANDVSPESDAQHNLSVLCGLVQAVASDPRIQVVRGPPGCGWSLDPRSRRIQADPDDLLRLHADDLRALACHEAAHAAVTRYPDLVPDRILLEPGMAPLLNALEDCRIETWLVRRFPGTEPWIRRTNERLVPQSLEALSTLPLSQQFCMASILEWWGSEVVGAAQEVVEALEETREARRAVVAAQPPVDVMASGHGYVGSAAARCFADADRVHPPDGFERAVRLSAWTSWETLWRTVRTPYRALVRQDLRNRPLFEDDERTWVRRVRGLAPGGFGASAPTVAAGAGLDPGALHRARHAEPDEPDLARYERARRRVAPLVEQTVAALLPLVTRARVPTWGGRFASGGRVDLRRVMQGEADPRVREQVWQRRSVPARHDPALHLLVDLSGSMSGERIDVAFAGVVLLCEVLHRLKVPFAVSGFQDRRLPLKEEHEVLDVRTRTRIGSLPLEVEGRRPGGRNRPEENHDGPVLVETARALLSCSASDHWLWVLSDGLPTGPGDGVGALEEAVAVVGGRVRLVGIGLGPGTGHVARFYPHALPEVPLHELPAALGALVDRTLRAP